MRGKNEQLEDMYTQIDSMQECIDSLEQDKSELSASQAIAQKQASDLQRTNMDL